MPQDAYTLRYLCEELDQNLSGGRINRITQPNVDVTVFTVYTEKGVKKLLLDTDPAAPRIGITANEPQADDGTVPNNFCMLLRKHLISATIDKISIVGFDRIVRIDLTPTSQFFDAPPKVLYAELMGRYSNVILTENGKVMGANRGVNFFDNNVRPLITGLDYRFPPMGNKKEPSDDGLKEIFVTENDVTAENISANVSGIAVSTAEEIVRGFLASGRRISEFTEYLKDFIYNTRKRPCVTREKGEIKDVFVFPYGAAAGEKQYFESLSLAEELYFDEKKTAKKLKEMRTGLNSLLNSALKKADKRLAVIAARIKDAAGAEEDRIKGELILANIYRLKGGEEKAVFDNYYDGGKTEIVLDKKLSPAKNAENYYKKYNKKKRAEQMLTPQKERAEEEIAYIKSVIAEVRFSDDAEDLKSVRRELAGYGLIKTPQQKGKKAVKDLKAPRIYELCGFLVRAGRNNTENDEVTFSAKPKDIWLHAKEGHSSHVVIETNGKKVPDAAIRAAAEVCAYYSDGRDSGKTEIAYCEKKNVKKPKGAKPGFCIYSGFKSITVTPDAHADERKNG